MDFLPNSDLFYIIVIRKGSFGFWTFYYWSRLRMVPAHCAYLPWHADPDVPRWHEQVPPVHGYPEHSAEYRHPVRGAVEKTSLKNLEIMWLRACW